MWVFPMADTYASIMSRMAKDRYTGAVTRLKKNI